MFDILNIGNKARSLLVLQSNNFNVPTFVLIPGSYIPLLLSDDVLKQNLIDKLIYQNIHEYSVRSSPEYSMPGMMETVLNNKGYDELFNIIRKVYDSYNSTLAVLYRKRNNIPDTIPSVIIQKMVYGTGNGYSGSGVAYSRNNFGIFDSVIEFKENHQGDVIVSNQVDIYDYDMVAADYAEQIKSDLHKLEHLYKCPVEIEFTIQDGVMYMLQCRELQFQDSIIKYKIYTDLVKKHIISVFDYDQLIGQLYFNSKQIKSGNIIYTGYPVSAGIVQYKYTEPNIYFSNKIDNSILDVIDKYEGIITNQGSLTSHISIVCRNMNIPYIILPDVDLNILSTYNFTMDGYSGSIYDSCDIITITKENINQYV